MQKGARAAYDTVVKATEDGRTLEATALLNTAREIEACQAAWDTADRDVRLDRALRMNQRLWSVFQAELGGSKSRLSRDLRVRLLQLSAFIDQRTMEILAQPDPRKLQILIDINRHIAAGLREGGG